MLLVTLLGIAILFGLAVFQFLLILRRPLGNFAWGGQHKVLPPKLQIASCFAVALYMIFALFLLIKAGLVDGIMNAAVVNIGMWIFTAFFIIGIFLNGISRSKKERFLMTPITFILALIFLAVSITG